MFNKTLLLSTSTNESKGVPSKFLDSMWDTIPCTTRNQGKEHTKRERRPPPQKSPSVWMYNFSNLDVNDHLCELGFGKVTFPGAGNVYQAHEIVTVHTTEKNKPIWGESDDNCQHRSTTKALSYYTKDDNYY